MSNPTRTVLIVDDDPHCRTLLRCTLSKAHYRTLEAENGQRALAHAPHAHALLLDIGLPDLSGWQVARTLQQQHPHLPIVFLTGTGGIDARLRGFELGADDYLVKPFDPREILARLRVVLRRHPATPLRRGPLQIDPHCHSARIDGRQVDLSPTEFKLLCTFAQTPQRVWRRDELLERVWGSDYRGVDRTVDVRVRELRKKLGDDSKNPRFIETIRGVGYRFLGGQE